MTESTRSLTAAQAAARLGVKPATLYAYVSRGLIARTKADDGRTSLFDPRDLARLERRSGRRHGSPSEVVVASELTLVDGEAGRLVYRGLDPVDACAHRRFEEIAGWLWNGNFDGPSTWPDARVPDTDAASIPDRVALAAASAASGPASASPTREAATLMTQLVCALPGADLRAGSPFATRLFAKLATERASDDAVKALDIALSLTADHGLTHSSLIARVAAASGARVSGAVSAALAAAIPMVRASRFTELEEAFARASDVGASRAVHELHPDVIPHATSRDPYPSGDPRARVILEAVARARPERYELVREMAEAVRARGGAAPTAVFAQAALAWAIGLRPGSGEAISLLSRAAGWIAHALEEYRRPTPFRPRLAYVGRAPRSTPIRTLDAVVSYLGRDDELTPPAT